MGTAIVEPVMTDGVLAEQALSWPERARSMKIVDAETYELMADELKAIKGLRAQIEDTFGPIVTKALAAHREAVAQRKKYDEPLNLAEQTFKQEISRYTTEQTRIRREAEDKARKEAEELALLEREIEIETAEAEGATVAEVKALVERPVQVTAPPPVLPRATPKVSGISTRDMWAAEVTDLAALVKFVAAHPAYLALLTPNMTAINQQARSLKQAMQIPGVRVFNTPTVSARRF